MCTGKEIDSMYDSQLSPYTWFVVMRSQAEQTRDQSSRMSMRPSMFSTIIN